MSQKCPACGYISDAYRDLEVNNDFDPNPGDVGICLKCGVKQTIDGAGQLILLSPEMEALLDFKTKEILNQAQKVWGQMFVRAS